MLFPWAKYKWDSECYGWERASRLAGFDPSSANHCLCTLGQSIQSPPHRHSPPPATLCFLSLEWKIRGMVSISKNGYIRLHVHRAFIPFYGTKQTLFTVLTYILWQWFLPLRDLYCCIIFLGELWRLNSKVTATVSSFFLGGGALLTHSMWKFPG